MAGLVVLLSVCSCIFGLFVCASEVNPLPGPLGNEKQLPSSARGERSDYGILSYLGNIQSMEESAETTPETCDPKYADSGFKVYDEVTEESAVPQHKTGSVTEDQSEETDSLYHDDNKDSRQPRSWTGQDAVVETTPAVCLHNERCGFQVYDQYTRQPSMNFISYCTCPEDKECLVAGDNMQSKHYFYKCRSSATTEFEIINGTSEENSTIPFNEADMTNSNVNDQNGGPDGTGATSDVN